MASENISSETLLDHLPDGVCLVDRNEHIIFWNRGAERITGHSRDAVQGSSCAEDILGHADERGRPAFGDRHPALLCMEDQQTREGEYFVRHRDGGYFPVFMRIRPIVNSVGEVIGALEVFSDAAPQVATRKRIQELEELALLCPLTGVGNRRYAQMALNNAFEELRRYGWSFGLLFVDIDEFKKINDTYGHGVGDEVLQMVAHALRASLRSFDFVGRWGGEEFVVILPNITDDVLEAVAERCRRVVEESAYQHMGKQIQVTVSVGAVLADPEETADACVERADNLMYQSKSAGRNRVTTDL